MDQHAINPTTDVIFSLLKTSLWGEERFPLPPLEGTDWACVCAELRHHAIQNLVTDQMTKADPAHKDQYLKRALQGLSHWYRLMREQQTACTLLQEAGIPCTVLKGAAADYAYPRNVHRTMGDIDLIVKPQDFDRAYDLLIQGGEYVGKDSRHIEIRRNGILLELHQIFSTSNDPKKRALLDGWIMNAIDTAETITLEGYTFPMLPRPVHGLVLLEHINQHMESGLGLRQIIDWMMFAHCELTDTIWEEEYALRIKQLGLETLAITVTRMCQRYLGLRSDLTFCHSADDSLCRELMAHILQQGNFGRKQPHGQNQILQILSAIKKGPAFFQVLQHNGCQKWEALKKYPFLKPFAWLYLLCRCVYKGFHIKHPIRQLYITLKNEHRQDLLLDQLGVSRLKNSKH